MGYFCSHWHFDHVGNPDVFPGSTELVVGPGVKDAFMPGYPAREDSSLRESDFKWVPLRTKSLLNFHALQLINISKKKKKKEAAQCEK